MKTILICFCAAAVAQPSGGGVYPPPTKPACTATRTTNCTVTADSIGAVSVSATVQASNLGVSVTAPPYNAKGDGTTNDLPAFQAACAAAQLGNKVLIIPPTPVLGSYYKLDFTGGAPATPVIACFVTVNGMSIIGSGRASRIHMANWSVANGVAVPSSGGDGIHAATVFGFGGYEYPYVEGVTEVYQVNGGLVRDVYITGEWNGTDYFPNDGTFYSRGSGVGLFNASNVTVDNVECYRISGTCVSWSGNHVAFRSVYGVRLSRVRSLENALGINFQGGMYDGAITDSTITGSGWLAAGIEVACEGCTLSNNLIIDNQYIGLDHAGSDGTISQNVVMRNGYIGVIVEGQVASCARNSLNGNVVVGNGRTGDGANFSSGIRIGVTCNSNSITGGSIKNNGKITTGTGVGIGVYVQGHRTRITGVEVGDDLATKAQSYGVFSVAADDLSLVGNIILGNRQYSVQIVSGARPTLTNNNVDFPVIIEPAVTASMTAPACSQTTVLSTNAAFLAASTTATVALATLPVGAILMGSDIKHSAQFSDGAGAMTDVSVSIGSAGGGATFYEAARSIGEATAVAATTMYSASMFKRYTTTSEAINAVFTATGADFGTGAATSLTGGSVTIKYCYVVP